MSKREKLIDEIIELAKAGNVDRRVLMEILEEVGSKGYQSGIRSAARRLFSSATDIARRADDLETDHGFAQSMIVGAFIVWAIKMDRFLVNPAERSDSEDDDE